jgi:allophanate hydrolase subunit 2
VPYGWLETIRHPNPPSPSRAVDVHVVAGPRDEEFPPDALETLCDAPFRVAPRSNHMGLRLEGPSIPTVSRRGTRVSEPMPIGGVQITPSGGPIVLLNARGTIGGYPLLATVVSVDVWNLGQARVGDEVRFQAVSVEEAQALTREARARLAGLQPISKPLPLVAGPRYAPWSPHYNG